MFKHIRFTFKLREVLDSAMGRIFVGASSEFLGGFNGGACKESNVVWE